MCDPYHRAGIRGWETAVGLGKDWRVLSAPQLLNSSARKAPELHLCMLDVFQGTSEFVKSNNQQLRRGNEMFSTLPERLLKIYHQSLEQFTTSCGSFPFL